MSALLTLMRASHPAPRAMIALMSLEEILGDGCDARSSLLGWLVMDCGLASDDDLGASV